MRDRDENGRIIDGNSRPLTEEFRYKSGDYKDMTQSEAQAEYEKRMDAFNKATRPTVKNIGSRLIKILRGVKDIDFN